MNSGESIHGLLIRIGSSTSNRVSARSEFGRLETPMPVRQG
jgi:hypothetical protein